MFYLSARQINKINNSRWRFWVLKNIHYLQDFVEIKKFAERRNYIKTTENFLDKESIIRKSKKSEHKKLLDKLEIFEYAFARNLESNLPENLVYKANKWNAFLFILWSLLWFGGFILGGILQIRDYNYKYGDFHFNVSLIFISFISILLLGILLRWVSFLFIKNALLEVNLEGVNIKGFEKGQLISWEYIHKVEYIKEIVGEDTIHYLYFRFKYVQYPNKFKKKEFKIATSNLKLRGDIIYQQVNAMHQKYLDKQKKKTNFKS